MKLSPSLRTSSSSLGVHARSSARSPLVYFTFLSSVKYSVHLRHNGLNLWTSESSFCQRRSQVFLRLSSCGKESSCFCVSRYSASAGGCRKPIPLTRSCRRPDTAAARTQCTRNAFQLNVIHFSQSPACSADTSLPPCLGRLIRAFSERLLADVCLLSAAVCRGTKPCAVPVAGGKSSTPLRVL